ncbi:MAG TPA: HAD-IC family P-type ATPase, partial [Candidatus Nanoarchaeia archaeon]|nr:HAD-IC family P-type ATPase [Candidatus Nanoarchaeia archaeon]
MAENYHALTTGEVLALFSTSKQGLSEEKAKARLQEFGLNELQKEKRSNAFFLFVGQFRNALSILLIFAGVLSLFTSDKLEAIAIFSILFINSTLGFIQEYRAEKAMEALEKISAPSARVLRDGKQRKIPARDLVPGDIIMLEAGDIVPADSRLLDVASMYIDEASLTGESVPSKKFIEPLKNEITVADRENMAYTGTIVTYGKAKAIVVSTGMNTEFGKIAASIQETEEPETPLQNKFAQLAKQIGFVVMGLIIVVLAAGTIQKTVSFAGMVLFALALTVSTIPSSLPIIVTVSLSMGAKRLSRKNMLIKKLPAAESLGAATIICSDKTGTITKNQMTITHIYSNDKVINVTGAGYEPKGEFKVGNKTIDSKELELLLKIGYLCNNAKLEYVNGKHELIGDPTEGSLIVLAKKGELDEKAISKRCVMIKEHPFDSERKRMSMIFKNEKRPEAYVKGAPDLLLEVCSKMIKNSKICPLTAKEKKKILDANNKFAEQSLRVLGLAYKDLSSRKRYTLEEVEKDLIFIGLVGMMDPPRDEVKDAVKQCHEAGIKVMLITGDHAVTTKAIAKNIGLFSKGDLVMTGEELDKMTDDALEKQIDKIRIIARALPIQKSRIVDILQKKGHIVAMTGDGVNDAPALKKSDIGISMGVIGTDVA